MSLIERMLKGRGGILVLSASLSLSGSTELNDSTRDGTHDHSSRLHHQPTHTELKPTSAASISK